MTLGRSLRVVVADDDPLARKWLELLLGEQPEVELAASVGSGEAAVAAIRAHEPDVVFLDVRMPECTGLEVVRAIGAERMPATIFVTADDGHAVEAFELGALDYLVKPVGRERFAQALERARRAVALEAMGALRERLLAALERSPLVPALAAVAPASPSPDVGTPNGEAEGAAPAESVDYLERIAVEMKGRARVIPVAEIEYIVSSGPYAELHVGDRRWVVRETMQALEARLDPARFVRIHRSVIVRLELIETLLRGQGGHYEVQLRTGARLRVSRARREELERRLGVMR
jgi:two-component system LytT family response regulator